MGYAIQALIAKAGAIPHQHSEHLKIVRMDQGMELLPITSELRERLGIPSCPLTDSYDDDPVLPEAIAALCQSLSRDGTVAYLEAEFWGGDGVQASALFRAGVMLSAPVVSSHAINEALRAIGVTAGTCRDEFEALGLGRCRDTDEWLQ